MQELTGSPGAGYLNSNPKKKEEAKLVNVSYLPMYPPCKHLLTWWRQGHGRDERRQLGHCALEQYYGDATALPW